MTSDLAALLIPPQEERLRSNFGLGDAPLQLVTSGWQKLIVRTPDRVFAFPRTAHQIAMVEREADVLSAVRPDSGPQLLGLHRDPAISPYPFLELTLIPGTCWSDVELRLDFEDAAQCLEQLAKRIARIHKLPVPPRLASRPDYLDHPRITRAWTHRSDVSATTARAADMLSQHGTKPQAERWAAALAPIAAMKHTAVHGEISNGQFLVDDRHHITGIVDWDGLHIGHPLLDLDFGVDLYRIYEPETDRDQLRQRIWTAYSNERGDQLPEWPSLRLFWSLLDATTVLHEGNDARLPQAIADLDAASYALN